MKTKATLGLALGAVALSCYCSNSTPSTPVQTEVSAATSITPLPRDLGVDPTGARVTTDSIAQLFILSRATDLKGCLDSLWDENPGRGPDDQVVFAIEEGAIPGMARAMMARKSADAPVRICLLKSLDDLGVDAPGKGLALFATPDARGIVTELVTVPTVGVKDIVLGRASAMGASD